MHLRERAAAWQRLTSFVGAEVKVEEEEELALHEANLL